MARAPQTIAPYHAAAIQTAMPSPSHRDAIPQRIEHMLTLAGQTISGYEPFFDVRLLVFPEFAHTVPIHTTLEPIVRDLAVELDGTMLDPYARFCAQHGCWIQTGSFLEVDPAVGRDVVFNTTVLMGPDGIELTYRKLNPWIPWEIHASPHDLDPAGDHLPVAHTEIGSIGVAICYDWLFPEVLRELRHKGAEVLCRVSAYMDPWGATPPMDWWTLFNRARAAENTCFVVASNQGAHMDQYPPFSWPGGSMVVDFDGRVLAQADPGPGEKVVVAPIDVMALRAARDRRRGHDMTAHHRGAAYPYARQAGFPPATDHPISVESLDDRIAKAKERPS